jgi:hypothetical protein
MNTALTAAPWVLAAMVALIIVGAWRRDHLLHPRVRKAGTHQRQGERR